MKLNELINYCEAFGYNYSFSPENKVEVRVEGNIYIFDLQPYGLVKLSRYWGALQQKYFYKNDGLGDRLIDAIEFYSES